MKEAIGGLIRHLPLPKAVQTGAEVLITDPQDASATTTGTAAET